MQILDLKVQNHLDRLPGIWVCKDLHSVYTYVNQEWCHFMGVDKPWKAVGMTDAEIPTEVADCAELFIAQDQEVLKTRKSLRILDIHPDKNGDWQIWFSTKSPLLDQQSNTVIGTIFHGINITESGLIMLGGYLGKISEKMVPTGFTQQSSYMIGYHHARIKLPEFEGLCLFFFLYGKNARQIGQLLRTPLRQVNEALANLKYYFNASSLDELVDQAVANGFLKIIPEGVFKHQLSLALKD